jgi:hypothetical protein
LSTTVAKTVSTRKAVAMYSLLIIRARAHTHTHTTYVTTEHESPKVTPPQPLSHTTNSPPLDFQKLNPSCVPPQLGQSAGAACPGAPAELTR